MNSSVRVVFWGKVLPGHNPEQVKSDMSALLKLGSEKIASVFSGKRVVLRQGLPADQAPRYKAHLEKLGVEVVIEPMGIDADTSRFPVIETLDEPAPGPDVTLKADAKQGAPVAPALAASSDAEVPLAQEEMECPKCHERQPKRTLCCNCAVDMPRFLAAQLATQEEEKAKRLAARQAAASARRPTSRASGDVEYARNGASWLGMGLSGRVDQMSYLVGILVSSAVGIWLFLAAMKTHSLAILLLVVSVLGLFGLRLAVLRLHDIGVTGWWWLVSFVPIANFALTVVLFFVPGSREDKGYGLPSRGSGLMSIVVSALLLSVSAALFVDQVKTVLPALVAAYSGKIQGSQPDAADETGRLAGGAADFHHSSNTVIMYSLSTCPYCAQKRRELDASGIAYTEVFIDQDEQGATTLQEKLQRAGLPPRSYGVPILDVNGTMLPNNPTMSEIARHLS